ncbi:CNH domain-containing protein [Russula aff. rugulosa BPL654]|nr:CNH domain-containing protein [Russula aff. rugulosa BPL654]
MSPESATDSRVVYPCTILHTGRLGGLYTVYAESAQARSKWKDKLQEAIGLRKVFEVETLSSDTLVVGPRAWMGKINCSVPFTTRDGRAFVAVGCTRGVWIESRHDSRSMRRVLPLKMVTQCAMLEDFGIFLVLADKSLFAYHIEALVTTPLQSPNTSQTPQKLNGSNDVHFFSVGSLGGRTLVIYKVLDSVFHVLEPVVGKINERTKAPVSLSSRIGLRQPRSEWFRVHLEFHLSSESYDLFFLKTRIAILCTKGFEIINLSELVTTLPKPCFLSDGWDVVYDLKSVTIPQFDDPRHKKLAKRIRVVFKPLRYPSRTEGIIEWEGTAEHVAWHPPYILIFNSRFIEVRHVETGRLRHVIHGNDIRCICDGRGASMPHIVPGPNGAWEEVPSQEARVHCVMRADDTSPGRAGPSGVVQHIFDLIPTVP